MITSSAPATHSPRRRHPDLRPIPPAAAARLLTAEAAPVYRCADSSPMRINDLGARARCRRTAVPMQRTAMPMILWITKPFYGSCTTSPAAILGVQLQSCQRAYRCADAGAHLSTVGSRRTAVPMPLGRTAVPTVSSTWCYTMQ